MGRKRQVGLAEQVPLRPSQLNQGKVLKIFVPKLLCAQTLAWPWYTCPALSLTNPRLRACRPLLLPQAPFFLTQTCKCCPTPSPLPSTPQDSFQRHLLPHPSSLPIPLLVANMSLAVSRIRCARNVSLLSPLMTVFLNFESPAPGTKPGSRLTSKNFVLLNSSQTLAFLYQERGQESDAES